VLNAANEVAVAEFLEGRLPFNAIAAVIAQAMDAHRPAQVATRAEVRQVDGWARDYSLERARKVTIGSLK
jgi:1-deoxy-D-xylulose-5-phosphate reductoisomerase